jgi:hypothetical protein
MSFSTDHRENALDLHFHAHRLVQQRIEKDRADKKACRPTDRQIEDALTAAGVPDLGRGEHDLQVARAVLEAFA